MPRRILSIVKQAPAPNRRRVAEALDNHALCIKETQERLALTETFARAHQRWFEQHQRTIWQRLRWLVFGR